MLRERLRRIGMLAAPVLAAAWLLALPAQAEGPGFKGQNLSGRDFTGRQLAEADFSGAVLRGAVFKNAKLKGADFRNADLRGADLSGADLNGADFRGAKMPFTASGANFSGANLSGLDLQNASLARDDFRGADLSGTRGWGGVTGCHFDGANLAGADFASAWSGNRSEAGLFATARSDAATAWPKWATGVSRRPPEAAPAVAEGPRSAPSAAGAPQPGPSASSDRQAAQARAAAPKGRDLRGRKFAGQKLRSEDFDGADLEGADLSSADLSSASLRNADLRSADLRSANLRRADLTGADLRGAQLDKASFRDAKLAKAVLEDQTLYLAGASIFYEGVADLPYAIKQAFSPDRDSGYLSFRGANLRNTRILGNLDGVDFRGADLRGADLSEAQNIDKAILRGAVYDGRTKWNVEPERIGVVRGEDVPLPTKWFFGTWGIDKAREGEPDAKALGVLKLNADGTFMWDSDPGEGEPVNGRWELVEDAKSKRLLLHGGELGIDWVAVPQASGDLVLKSRDGKHARSCFRG